MDSNQVGAKYKSPHVNIKSNLLSSATNIRNNKLFIHDKNESNSTVKNEKRESIMRYERLNNFINQRKTGTKHRRK